jgi:hypothetical protein
MTITVTRDLSRKMRHVVSLRQRQISVDEPPAERRAAAGAAGGGAQVPGAQADGRGDDRNQHRAGRNTRRPEGCPTGSNSAGMTLKVAEVASYLSAG